MSKRVDRDLHNNEFLARRFVVGRQTQRFKPPPRGVVEDALAPAFLRASFGILFNKPFRRL